ncbi:MAG: enoyl-CoA hydratase/isomerase family protein [Dehalococcoidia bacterium]|jgi:enoyl-CoA hydratase|nr:enoyl-CoA hydratase/isomerase family protein [Dehalococcoidia bacterium]MDP7083168.1 enoyl-CoA hydratase/isomerase family protein [Dehalococcoidia bacterium]MDP7199952.1 enoyl-CoA hydratase/isomerase family protein [Dehalococcoidia bacterium]MDP7509993.1 enoyl-CoA hydratase/isomerase family protein [Dehalococcoidia bacterium]HJN86452.1 enoyl-CoA hydratase/isomerase family protein [Dehalococcoidia bacterium]
MDYKYVLYEKEGQAVRITLNRPEKLNVIDFPGQGGILDNFYDALSEAEDDDDVKVVVIRGAGRSFCAGHDLEGVGFIYGFGTGQPGERRASQRIRLKVDRRWMELHLKLLTFPKITICQVHGHCIGEGTLMMEYCDLAIVAEDAQISHSEQRLGFSGSGSNLLPLYLTVGYKRARELLLRGRAISGTEAAAMGLANRAVPLERLEAAVQEYVDDMVRLPLDGISIGKATNHWILDILGATTGMIQGYQTHTLFTNIRFEPGEFSFFRERRNQGARAAFHARDDRYT